LLQHFF